MKTTVKLPKTKRFDPSSVVLKPATSNSETLTRKQLKTSAVVYKKTTLKSDYMLAPANAIAIGKFGPNKNKLILANGCIDLISIMDVDTGKIIRQYGKEYGTTGALDDVTEGPDGTLYFTSLCSEALGYIRPDGTHGKIPIGKMWSNSICVTLDGKWLFYGLCIGDDQLWRLPLENGLPRKGAKAELVEQSGGWSNSMVCGDDGFIYSPSNMYGEIRRINPDTKEITVIADNTEFPSSVDRNDTTGVLYVSEFHLGQISRIDPSIKDTRKNKRVLSVTVPGTDNVAVMSGPKPRIFGTSFPDDWIFECFENGDPVRTVSRGGMLPFSLQILKGPNGDRFFSNDLMRVREFFPAGNTYRAIAHANFWQFAEDKVYDRGVKRFDEKRINWTASFDSSDARLSIPCGKVMQLTPEGNLLCAGSMFEFEANRISIIDADTGKSLRVVKNLDYIQDAIKVGKDLYIMEGTTKEYPIAPRITRITPDDQRETVFKGKNFLAFARDNNAAYANDAGANTIYQVAKGGKWLAKPIKIVSGLKGPQGIAIANDGNLLVMENNEGWDGRLLKVNVKTGEITVLADGLAVNPKLDPRTWGVINPRAVVGQTSDGAIFFTEPGATSFSVLRAE
jgi:sugar lactone lactonase YvrE